MENILITPNNPKFFAGNDSQTIQNAVNYAHENDINKVVIPRFNARTGENKWISDEAVKLPSNMHIVLDNCFMQKADDVFGGFFCSENYTENGERLNERLNNIKITGVGNAVLDGGKPTALNELTAKEIGMPAAVNSPIIFLNVEHFRVENLTVSNQRYWGMRFEFCAHGIIRDIFFDIYKDRRNQDGINLRNGCYDILIENISGQTGDDMIALSAIDYYAPNRRYPIFVDNLNADIHDVTIRNITGAAIHHPLVALRNHNGAKIYNITIEDVKDTEQIHSAFDEEKFNYERYGLITIGCNAYYKTESVMGDTFNISVNNAFCRYSYRAIYAQGTLKNCRFSNIYASDKCRHILSVMPDGWASARSGVTIENVTFENVFFEADKNAPTSILTAEPDLKATVVDFPKMRECDYVKNLYFNNIFLKNTDCFAEIAESAKDRVEIALGRVVADTTEATEFCISDMPDAKERYWGDPDLPKDQV